MNKKVPKEELAAAYKLLWEAENQIKNLLIERKQLHLTLQLLQTAGFIKEGKMDEAREFVSHVKND